MSDPMANLPTPNWDVTNEPRHITDAKREYDYDDDWVSLTPIQTAGLGVLLVGMVLSAVVIIGTALLVVAALVSLAAM